jgi:methyltransferase
MTFVLVLAATAFVPMILEALLSRANERALRALGAREPAGDVYAIMQLAYPGCFVAMTAEAWWRGTALATLPAAGVGLFVAAKALKYWAIATLGPRWTFRVLVPPNGRRIRRGPYRFLRHPNYVGVVGEIAGFAMMAAAPITGAASLLVFGVLMLRRVRIEEAAMQQYGGALKY